MWQKVLVSILILSAALGCGRGDSSPEAPAASTDPQAQAASEETDAAAAALADAMRAFRAQDPDAAAEILERLTGSQPENASAWSFLGQIRRAKQDLEGAAAAYQSALTADPELPGAGFGLAAIHALRGDSAAALDQLHQLAALGKADLSQISIAPDFESVRDDERFQELLMKPEDFADPFVEPTRVLQEWVGEAAGDEFGWVARNVGDVDGDGIADAATSAPSKNIDGEQAGRIYVYSSASGELLWSHSGEPGDRLGVSVESAGDVDGDGAPDVVASAPAGGKVFVFRGRDGKVLLELAAAADGEMFGRDVLGLGDVDVDGHGDLLVGSPMNGTGGERAGRAAVYSGKDGSILHQWLGEAGERLGAAAAGQAGEPPLYILGAPDAGDGDGGRVYVYRGFTDEPAFVIDPGELGSELGGMFLSVVGDVDGDGADDVYASDWSHGAKGPSTGRIFVHSGADGRRLLELTGEAAGDGFGIGPADAGDFDGDGHDDLVIGAWRQGSGAPAGGKVYLHSGADGSLIRTWTCRIMGDTFGFDATGMGDVDGDGKIDFLLTSAWSGISGVKSGRVFLVAGS